MREARAVVHVVCTRLGVLAIDFDDVVGERAHADQTHHLTLLADVGGPEREREGKGPGTEIARHDREQLGPSFLHERHEARPDHRDRRADERARYGWRHAGARQRHVARADLLEGGVWADVSEDQLEPPLVSEPRGDEELVRPAPCVRCVVGTRSVEVDLVERSDDRHARMEPRFSVGEAHRRRSAHSLEARLASAVVGAYVERPDRLVRERGRGEDMHVSAFGPEDRHRVCEALPFVIQARLEARVVTNQPARAPGLGGDGRCARATALRLGFGVGDRRRESGQENRERESSCQSRKPRARPRRPGWDGHA